MLNVMTVAGDIYFDIYDIFRSAITLDNANNRHECSSIIKTI